MRKLNLEKYTVSARDAKGVDQLIPYDFKESLIQLMFHPNLKLSGKALLETNIIVEKIMNADKSILLEEADYQKIKNAIDKNLPALLKNLVTQKEISTRSNVIKAYRT